MLKRLNIYLKEMYPVIPRLILGFIMFFEIYFLVIITNGARDIQIGYQEIIGAFTVFSFLLCLRIADEFKDYEVDKRLFPERAYPSGRVKTKDLVTLLTTVCVIMIPLNLFFMNNKSLSPSSHQLLSPRVQSISLHDEFFLVRVFLVQSQTLFLLPKAYFPLEL